MFTAWAFWMMKIITTMRAATPAISPVRKPLIRVCSRRRRGACGADWGGGAEPLAEGRGRVLARACGAAGSVMALLFSRTGTELEDLGHPVAHPRTSPPSAAVTQCLQQRTLEPR